jgi:hypothetical protein
LGLFVLAANIDPAFAVKPIVRRIVSAAGTTAPLITKLAAAAGDANAPGGIIIKLYDTLVESWLQIAIVETIASVDAGTTYTFVCVFADGLIAPNLL